MTLLLIDHRDSFTYNLVEAFRVLGAEVEVVRHAGLRAGIQERRTPGQARGDDAIILSPGPGRPSDYPETTALLNQLPDTMPVLGVCLGMQILNEWSGGQTVHAPRVTHGKVSPIYHARRGVFGNLASPCTVARYHSLACQITSPDWEVTAQTEDQTPMAMQHRVRPWVGLQFHPESFMTPDGQRMLRNWMGQGGSDGIRL